jgi:hypothetical protein
VRRRRNADESPADLLVFEGFRHLTERAWRLAFMEFLAAREAWSDEHEGVVLAPYEVEGYCPFDANRFRKSTG